MSVERGGGDHGRQLMNLHNNEAGRRVSEFQNVPPISDGSGTQNLGFVSMSWRNRFKAS